MKVRIQPPKGRVSRIKPNGLWTTRFDQPVLNWSPWVNAVCQVQVGTAHGPQDGMVKVLTRPNSVLRRTQAGDILLAIDDVPLAEDGSIPFRDAERIGCLGQWRQV